MLMTLRKARGESHSRSEPRYDFEIEGATLREPSCSPAAVTLHDLSVHGFRTDWPYVLKRGNRVWLRLPGYEALAATVAWNTSFDVGCTFEHPLHPAILDDIVTEMRGRQTEKRKCA